MKRRLFILILPILLILTGAIMDNSRDKIWYKKSATIDCPVEKINNSLADFGKHYEELIKVYPGVTTVELVDQGKGYIHIKTNEGLMKRTNISISISDERTRVEFDEEYITSAVTSNAHFVETFDAKSDSTELNIEISNHSAPGFLGFFLRNFGSKNIGNGFLSSYQEIFGQ